jgi:hypothetical protein
MKKIENAQKEILKNPSSGPSSKKNVKKKGFKEVPQVYLQKRKNCPKKKEKRVPSRKNKCQNKKFQILFHPLLSALVSSFMTSSLDM